MGTDPVVRSFHRSLCRVARQADANYLARTLLFARPLRLYDRRASKARVPQSLKGESKFVDDFLLRANGGSEHFPGVNGGMPLRRLAARAMRPLPGEQVPDLQDGFELLRRINAAVVAAKESALPVPDSGDESATFDGLVEATKGRFGIGSLLVGHPTACVFQRSLHRSLIILTAAEADDGVVGVCVNKPLSWKVGDFLRAVQQGKEEQTKEYLQLRKELEPFATCRMYLGGDVSFREGALTVLHTVDGIESSQSLGSGLFANGSLKALGEAMKERKAAGLPPDQVGFFLGYAGWQREQLEIEIERRVWWVCGEEEAQDNTAPLRRLVFDGLEACEDSSASGQPPVLEPHARAAWSAVLDTLGYGHLGCLPDVKADGLITELIGEHFQEVYS